MKRTVCFALSYKCPGLLSASASPLLVWSWKGDEWHSRANKCAYLIFLNEHSHGTAGNAEREAAGKGGRSVLFFAGFILFARNTGGLPGTLRCCRLCCGAGRPRETEMPQLGTWELPGLVARSNARAVSLCFPGWVIGEKNLFHGTLCSQCYSRVLGCPAAAAPWAPLGCPAACCRL